MRATCACVDNVCVCECVLGEPLWKASASKRKKDKQTERKRDRYSEKVRWVEMKRESGIEGKQMGEKNRKTHKTRNRGSVRVINFKYSVNVCVEVCFLVNVCVWRFGYTQLWP